MQQSIGVEQDRERGLWLWTAQASSGGERKATCAKRFKLAELRSVELDLSRVERECSKTSAVRTAVRSEEGEDVERGVHRQRILRIG